MPDDRSERVRTAIQPMLPFLATWSTTPESSPAFPSTRLTNKRPNFADKSRRLIQV
jgi:hypothetical protein